MVHSLLTSVKVTYLYILSFLLLGISITSALSASAQDVTEEWSRRYDGQGPGNEYFQASAIDEEGNIYISSTIFLAPIYGLNLSSIQHGQIMTLKYSSAGELLWAHQIITDVNLHISSYTEEARAIAVDGSGGVYLAGVRKVKEGSMDTNQDIILIKLNAADGTQVWETEYAAGEDIKEVSAISVDGANGVYLTGTTTTSSSFRNYLTLKFNSSTGVRVWAAQHEGMGERDDFAHAIALDSEDGLYVTGKSFKEFIFFPGRGPSYAVYEIATIKYDADTGEELWVSNYTGDTIQHTPEWSVTLGAALAVDDEGNVYVAGRISSLRSTVSTVTVKYSNQNGVQQWASRSNHTDDVPSLAIEGSDGVYVAGMRFGGSHQPYLVKYNAADGEQVWDMAYTGAAGNNLSTPDVTVGKNEDVFISSKSNSDGFADGLVTVRFNSTRGTSLWEKFYETPLSELRYFGSSLSLPQTALLVDDAGNPHLIGSAYTKDNRKNSNLFIVTYGVEGGAILWHERYEAIGSLLDFVRASAVDAEGNNYVAGISTGFAIGNDIKVVKYSSSGDELWVRIYDGGVHDRVEAIALDGAGGVYLAGTSGLSVRSDFLTLKLNASDGAVVWDALFDGGEDDSDGAYAIAVDKEEGVYVTGQSYRSNPASNSDIATVKYNATNGEQVWVKRYDGGYNLSDVAHAIAVDNTGGVYVTGGAVYSLDDYVGTDYATLKYNASDGEQMWLARYDGGNGYDEAISLALDRENGIYVAGRSTDETGRESFATIKYDSQNGSQLWANRFNSEGNSSFINDMVVDNAGGVYVTGSSFIMSSGQVLQAAYVTVKYEASDGEQRWVQTFGEDLSESRAYAIATDGLGGVYVTGHTVTGTEGERKGTAATLKYNTEDGALEWEMLKEGIDESGYTINLDPESNVYISGSSFSNSTYGDFLTIKYSQNGGCTPVVAQAITGNATVRAGTQNSIYTLSGTGATSYNWTVSGDEAVPISGQDTEQVSLDWPAEAGIYEVDVSYSAGEACLEQDTILTVAVFDPNAGFVIGAGWLDSPVNPELPYMQVGGRLHFAFASWYAKDARTVPGYSAFRFSSGGLDFRSAAHTPMRLVISGDMANYTGLGIVNGQEGYGFLVAAVDGDVGQGHQRDRLRLKVWELASGRVVYDNQTGAGEGAIASTTIEGGQIVIHRPLGRSLENLAALAEGISEGSVPEKHGLQAYPTIFSVKATVTFTLDQEQEFTIGLYDMNGMLLRNIGSGRASAGRQYEFFIDGERLSSGLYFVRLLTGAEVQTVKLLLRR